MIDFPIGFIAFLFGLAIGSFLNVCIHRIPLSQSIVTPRSRCPGCGQPIRSIDNIPLISYTILGGKCRACRTPISLRYPFVELLTGLFAAAAVWRFGFNITALVHYAFICVLIAITFIDIDHRIIPDMISLPGIPVFFFASLLVPTVTVKASILGILIGGGSLFAVAWGYYLLTGKEGMGGGDIKLLAMMGALLGWKGVLFTIFAGSAIGTLVGIPVMLYQRGNMKLAVPFGPFLALGGILYLFCGPEIMEWYFNLMRTPY